MPPANHLAYFDLRKAEYPIEVLDMDKITDPLSATHAVERIEEFEKAMRSGATFPPISVFPFLGKWYLADGHKRFSAYRRFRQDSIPAEVWPLRRLLREQLRQLRVSTVRSGRILLRALSTSAGRGDLRRHLWGIRIHWRRILLSFFSGFRPSRVPLSPKPTRNPRKKQRFFREMLFSLSLPSATALLHLFPRPVVWALGRWTGLIGFCALRQLRRISIANLDLAFGDSLSRGEKYAISYRSFQNTATTLLLLFARSRKKPSLAPRYFTYDKEPLHAIHKELRRTGLIAVTFHFGDWESLGLATSNLMPVTSIFALPSGSASLDRLLQDLREGDRSRVVSRGSGPALLKRSIESREIGALLCDRNANGKKGFWIEFFGKEVYADPLLGSLYDWTRAPLLLGVGWPKKWGKVDLSYRIIRPPESTDGESVTRLILDEIETLIRKQPDLWDWTAKRWKYRPAPDAKGYPFYSKFRRKYIPRERKAPQA